MEWYEYDRGDEWDVYGIGLSDNDAASQYEDTKTVYDEYADWVYWDLAQLTRDWISGTSNNYGIMLWATDETSYTNGDYKKFYSSEYGTTSLRPKLTVTYTIDPIVEYEYYTADGKPKSVLYGNDVRETNVWDTARGWLEERKFKEGTTEWLKIRNTGYDKVGNLKTQIIDRYGESQITMDYRYDDLNRIDTFKVNSTTEQTWVYDSNGNMTSFDGTTFTYSTGTNKISGDGSQTFTHDAAGRLTGKEFSGTSGTLSWDCLNNLTQAQWSINTKDYSYDANNNV